MNTINTKNLHFDSFNLAEKEESVCFIYLNLKFYRFSTFPKVDFILYILFLSPLLFTATKQRV